MRIRREGEKKSVLLRGKQECLERVQDLTSGGFSAWCSGPLSAIRGAKPTAGENQSNLNGRYVDDERNYEGAEVGSQHLR